MTYRLVFDTVVLKGQMIQNLKLRFTSAGTLSLNDHQIFSEISGCLAYGLVVKLLKNFPQYRKGK
jgi:hypothetical protein